MNENTSIKVWDPLVRIFHWSLVAGFFMAYFTEDDLLDLHVFAGYVVAGLITFRVLWGFVGSRYARFSDFVKGPTEVLAYLRAIVTTHPKRYLGHNPAGGAMVVALLISLVFVSLSGVALYGADESAGPLAAALAGLSDTWIDVLEELHEVFANFTLLLVIAHVTGVVLASRQHKENLVRAMLTGRKPRDV